MPSAFKSTAVPTASGIRAAHRKLIMELHPHRGGSIHLTPRVKDVLLRGKLEKGRGAMHRKGWRHE